MYVGGYVQGQCSRGNQGVKSPQNVGWQAGVSHLMWMLRTSEGPLQEQYLLLIMELPFQVPLRGFKIVFFTQIRKMMALTMWNFVVLPRSQNWWSMFLYTFAPCKPGPCDLTTGKNVCMDQNVDMMTYLRPYQVNIKGLENIIHYYCHRYVV